MSRSLAADGPLGHTGIRVIRFEDLMAARIVFQQLPDQRDRLMHGLQVLSDSPGNRALLADLVGANVLTLDQAQYVHHQVEAHKRERHLSLYLHLLGVAGVDSNTLARLRQQVGYEAGVDETGEAVCNHRILPPQREQQLRFQARLAFDRDMANQVAAHLAAHRAPAQNQPLGAQHSVLTSGVIRHDPSTRPVMPPKADVREILRGTLSDADESLPGPAFRIPARVDMSDPRTGKQLANHRILGRIGAGAMGVVYLADRQEEPERPVAIKLLPPDADREAKGRFKREILANGFFSHPGALDVYDAGKTEGGYHYLAMEFFDGNDLEQLLDEVGKLSPAASVRLALQVFQCLNAAHEAGVIHRDVKPANILIDGELTQARLMDFGIAVIKELDGFEDQVFKTMEGGVTGTPEYMSPEQAAGENLGPASDLYSMGVVLYHMLSGRLPFESETSSGFMTCHMIEDPLPLVKANSALKGQPKELLELVDQLLDKSPKKRPTGEEIDEVLTAVLPRLSERSGTSRLLSFLGWRRS
ncbi:MAG: serine/threonine protein kinase [Planctomycetes bacterium]|nr:serine/threonine protein kinase [Planctomycetota bacterium]